MLIEALNYKQWADRRTLDAVRFLDGSNSPTATAFALQQLNHMVRVEELFRARLLAAAAPHSSTNSELVPELDELEKRITDSNEWFMRYVEDVEPDQKNRSIHFQFVDGKRGFMTSVEVFFHVI